MEKNQNEKFAEAIKEFRGTIFEYSSSDSDEEDDKSKFGILSLKKNKAKSSMNLPVKWKNPKTNKNVVYLSRYVRMVLFLLLLIFSVIIDLDSGIIVSSYKSFTKDLNMSDIQFGTLSSITTVGEIIGLLFYMSIINKNHRKFILVTTSLLHGIGLFGYLINSNFYYISILNFLISVCKAFINVYMPVWIDQFGIKKYKTLLLTILYMAISMGMILGAWIGTVLFNNDWKKSFICEGLIFIGLSASLFAVPQKYYSTKYMIVEQQKISGNPVEKIVPTKDNSNDSKIKKNIENVKDIKYIGEDKKPQRKNKKMETIEEEKNMEKDNENEKKQKLINDNSQNTKQKESLKDNLSLISKLKMVFFNRVFIFSCIAKAIIFFVHEIVYIFFKIYTFEALHYDDEIKFFYYYSITTIAAPSLGGLIGGAICNKFFGGYESKKSIWIIIFFGTLSVLFISVVRVVIQFNKLMIFIFGYFFSSSAFLPTLSGYIINSLNKDLKGFGSSFDNLITNIFVLTSPILYGLLNDKYKSVDPKFAWNKSLLIYYFETIFIYLACFFKWQTNNKKVKVKSIVKKTMKDAYKLSRSSLVRADKPKPKFSEIKNLKDIELENLDESSSYN